MPLIFPNPGRSFDATRDGVRFAGHDGALECSFFVTRDALKRLAPNLLPDEAGLLVAFDMNREVICWTASRLYLRGPRVSYELGATDFWGAGARVARMERDEIGMNYQRAFPPV